MNPIRTLAGGPDIFALLLCFHCSLWRAGVQWFSFLHVFLLFPRRSLLSRRYGVSYTRLAIYRFLGTDPCGVDYVRGRERL